MSWKKCIAGELSFTERNRLNGEQMPGIQTTAPWRTYVVTDNDGVDGWSGETWFPRLGASQPLFG